LQRLLDEHYAAGKPVRWEDEDVNACFRCPLCTEQLRATDDLLLVAGMRVTRRDKLIGAGVGTVAELADHKSPVPDLAPSALNKLTAQAKLQVRQRDTGTPQFEIVDPQPLTLLPEPDPGDLFFDFEGDPLWTADGHDWGLEYLFGVLEAAGNFHPLWAHNRVDERKALTDFLAMVKKRRRRRPDMHIYHYAPYEKAALLRLAGRYGVGEDEVDELLRNHGAADLVTLTEQGLVATMLPFIYVPPEGPRPAGELGALHGHLARNNDQWKLDPVGEALAIVRGPDAYISPGCYASKAEHGRVVPTWNYVVVHAHGPLEIVEDRDWLLAHLEDLVVANEGGREHDAYKCRLAQEAQPISLEDLALLTGCSLALCQFRRKSRRQCCSKKTCGSEPNN